VTKVAGAAPRTRTSATMIVCAEYLKSGQVKPKSRRLEGAANEVLNQIVRRLGILRSEIDYHVLRASMVLIFLFFGYQKWFE
jgi:hypothetical protein